jgi:hypothetical protein
MEPNSRHTMAGLRSLCKYNYDHKDYDRNKPKSKQNKTKQNNPKRGNGRKGPSLTMKNEVLVKTTMAMSTNKIIKPNEIIRKKPDENTGIKSSKVKPAPLLDETASSEDKTASSESFLANSNGNADALLVSTGSKPSEMEPATPASFVDGTVLFEDIYFYASDVKAPSNDISAKTVFDMALPVSPVLPAFLSGPRKKRRKCQFLSHRRQYLTRCPQRSLHPRRSRRSLREKQKNKPLLMTPIMKTSVMTLVMMPLMP